MCVCVKENKNARGLAELLGVARPVLVPSVSEPGLDISLRDSTLLPQAHRLLLHTQKHKHTYLHIQYCCTQAGWARKPPFILMTPLGQNTTHVFLFISILTCYVKHFCVELRDGASNTQKSCTVQINIILPLHLCHVLWPGIYIHA